MPAKHGFDLQDGDIELLRFAHELRIARVQHFRTLTGRSEIALWRRLRKLRERRYLASAVRFMQQHIYTIGSAGLPVLIEHGYAERTLAEKRVRQRELKEIGLRHALHITNIHTRVLMLTRRSPLKIAVWREGPELWDTVLPKGGKAPIPIRPDVYLVLQNPQRPEGKNKLHLFIEADRGTMSHERMVQKVSGYLAYHDERRFAQKYPGMKSFHVITVTETRGRAEGLRDGLRSLIATAPLQRAYHFMAIEDLALEALLPHVERVVY